MGARLGSEPRRAWLLRRYMDAADRGDPAGIIELLREDAFCAMPPQPEWWVGREKIVAAWVEGGFASVLG